MRRGDKILYAVLLVTLAALYAGVSLITRGGVSYGLELDITVGGRRLSESEINRASELIEIRSVYGLNIISFDGRAARMVSADCPGGDCIRMTPLTSERGALVCLPHRLAVRLRAAKDKDLRVDVISR